MVKIIKTGWYHPRNANWNYGLWLVIDETGAKLYRETFGGENRMKVEIEKMHLSIHIPQAEYKWGEIKDLQDIEEYTGKNYPNA